MRNLTEEVVTSAEQALKLVREGEKRRRYGANKLNENSSRSHTIVTIIIESSSREQTDNSENNDNGNCPIACLFRSFVVASFLCFFFFFVHPSIIYLLFL